MGVPWSGLSRGELISLGRTLVTDRLTGIAAWSRRRVAAIVLLADSEEPELYLLPSTAWLDASQPFTDRDNVGKKSEPEFGVSLAHSSLPALERFRWDDDAAREIFR